VSYRPFTAQHCCLKCFFSILPRCLFVIIVMYAYFIDISQGTVETHLRCGGICNNHVIANCLQSVPVKELWTEHRSIIGKDMDKSKMPCFLWLTLYNRLKCVKPPLSHNALRVAFPDTSSHGETTDTWLVHLADTPAFAITGTHCTHPQTAAGYIPR